MCDDWRTASYAAEREHPHQPASRWEQAEADGATTDDLKD